MPLETADDSRDQSRVEGVPSKGLPLCIRGTMRTRGAYFLQRITGLMIIQDEQKVGDQ